MRIRCAAASILAQPVTARAAWPEPLPLGRESMYADLNQGNLKTADDPLRNVWPARGYSSVELPSPLSWTEDPYDDAFWRFMFYSLRYTSNLLWVYAMTNDVRYRDKLVEILRSYALRTMRRAASTDSGSITTTLRLIAQWYWSTPPQTCALECPAC